MKNFAEGTAFPEQASATYIIPAFLYRDRTPAPKTFPGLPTLATLDSVQEGVLRSDGSQFIPRMVTGIKGKEKILPIMRIRIREALSFMPMNR